MRARFAVVLTLLAGLAACVSPYSFESAAKEDTLDAWRRYLDENPNDVNMQPAFRRMAQIEFDAAVRAGSIWGFKKFLKDYPDADQAEAARGHLEELRFAKAKEEGTRLAYLGFLSFHANGALAEKARAAVMKIDYLSLAPGDREALRRYVAFYPDSPHRADAELRLDDADFAAASTGGEAGLLEYIARHKGGRHEVEARVLAAGITMSRAVARCRVRRAATLMDEMGRDPALKGAAAEWGPRVAEAKASCADRRALLSLDPPVLKRLAQGKGRYAGDAAAALKLSAGASFKDQKALTAAALARDEAGTIKALRAQAESPQPVARQRAAALARYLPRGSTVDLVLRLLGDTYLPVRHAAAESLVAIAAALTPASVERVFGARITGLEAQARDATLYFKVGVLYEARGLTSDALGFYRKAALADRYDPYLFLRLARMEAVAGESMKAIAAYGQLAKLAAATLAEREGVFAEKPSPSKEALASTAFQYCGVLDLLRDAEARHGAAAVQAKEIGKGERAAYEQVKPTIAAGGSFMARAAAALGQDERALCGGDTGAAGVARARSARRDAVKRASAGAMPWAAALLREVADFDPDPIIRNDAEAALKLFSQPPPKGAK